jgi:AraC family transcriptional regulator of arabinose operon
LTTHVRGRNIFCVSKTGGAMAQLSDARVRAAVQYIERSVRAGQSISLATLARTVNLSPSRLRHLIKEQTGIPPAEYLHNLRMQYARELMETTFLSVKQVRSGVGFSDGSNFSRAFKRAWGSPPTEYRAKAMLRR